MVRKNSKKKQNNRRPLLKNIEVSQANSLKQIVTLQRASQRAPEQVVPDIQRIRLRRQKVYTFSSSITGPNINLTPVNDSDGTINVTLNQLNDYASYSSIFDQYRIQQFTVEFLPVAPSTASSVLYTVFDYDDSTAAPISQLLQYDSLRVTPSNMFVERTVAPKVALAAYSGTFTSYASSSPWIDVASAGVNYYGLKYGLAASSTVTTTTLAYITTITIIVSFKNTR